MLLKRRHFLSAASALATAAVLPRAGRAAARARVVVVGGGWAGLAAARHLRELAPEIDVTLLEKNPRFWSCPLSNKWLVGQLGDDLLEQDYAAAARYWNYRFVQAAVHAVDRDARRVHSSAGEFAYDWLVLAIGIRHDWTAWFGDDREGALLAEQRFPPAWTSAGQFAALREKLRNFKGGDLLMTVPPAPFRCPPAPYERAALLAGWFAERRVPARILIFDANPPSREFQRLFGEFGDRVVYRTQLPLVAVDPHARRARTEFEEYGFDDAILLPPQQAADLAWQAGLIGSDSAGRPTGWVAADPLSFASHGDERTFVVGDALGHVSDLFGHYPKSAHMAVRQGRIAAHQIAARARGTAVTSELPDSLCHITTRYAPPEAIRLATTYRLRGDGMLMQQARTERNPQPQGEDIAWLRGLLAEVLVP